MDDTRDNNDNEGIETDERSIDERLLLQNKLTELEGELTDEKNRHLRTRADFENYRKRVEREAETSRLQIKKEILTDLLTFLDYFDQARRQLQDPAAAQGLEIMARQFNELLQKHGVKPVECIGLPFDPEAQEGIGYVDTEDCPEGCVAEEICTGYRLGDVLLKPARVMVAKKK
jgi:molecular chaperone GrpE